MNEKYEKIINLPHHVSKTREPMAKADRAAQFAPYSALSGYEDAVEETARLTDRRIELDEYEKERINAAVNVISASPPSMNVSITYFKPDKCKTGGAYVTVKGEISYIDEADKKIVLIGGYTVQMDDIIDIKIEENINLFAAFTNQYDKYG